MSADQKRQTRPPLNFEEYNERNAVRENPPAEIATSEMLFQNAKTAF